MAWRENPVQRNIKRKPKKICAKDDDDEEEEFLRWVRNAHEMQTNRELKSDDDAHLIIYKAKSIANL